MSLPGDSTIDVVRKGGRWSTTGFRWMGGTTHKTQVAQHGLSNTLGALNGTEHVGPGM